MHRSILSIGLAAIFVLGTFLAYNFAVAQEDDHEHAEHAAETAGAGPSVDDTSLAVEPVAQGLVLPTAMAFLDEHRMLVLEKDNGTVRMVEDGEVKPKPLLDVAVANDNERGMLGIAVSEESGTTYVFLYFTESGGGVDGDDLNGVPPAGNRLYRYELQEDRLVNPKLLLDLPAEPGPRYNGGPVVIGPDNNVYIIIGDVEGHATQVQNFENRSAADGTSGVLRIGKNGEDPEPVIGSGAFGKYYFAYGIRNSFGMAFDPETGTLWDTENGPAFGDEINLVEEGFNSGWRDRQGMSDESNTTGLVLFNSRSHYSNPEFVWTEPVGPTALAFLNSDKLGSDYENDMFVGDINNGAVYRFDLNENRSALALEGSLEDKIADTPEESEEAVFGSGFGGVTDIKTGPDGYLYVLSFIDGTIYRVVPAEAQAEVEVKGETTLTVESADLSNNTITGMFTTIASSNETVLQEGYTPLTFAGEEGASYTVTVADFGDRTFDHWDDDSTNNTREITLEEDTTITAYYEVGAEAEADTDGSNRLLDRLARILDGDECIDEHDQRRLDNALGKVIKDIFGEDEAKTDRLERMIDRIIEDCVNDNGRGQGNENNGIGVTSNGDDCESDSINNNLEILGEERTFTECNINGNLKIDNSEVRITNGRMNGNVDSEDSDLTLRGTEVRGNVHASGGSIELVNSIITGNLQCDDGTEYSSQGTAVNGNIEGCQSEEEDD
jgi:glucose/arabinose dehydrogenase